MPEHLALHLLTMAELHRAGRYDRMADSVQLMTGRPAMSASEGSCAAGRISAYSADGVHATMS